MSDFKWRHFKGETILQCVRWYCKYGLSYRDLEEIMRERGIEVDHTTIYRWVQHYGPELEKRLRWRDFTVSSWASRAMASCSGSSWCCSRAACRAPRRVSAASASRFNSMRQRPRRRRATIQSDRFVTGVTWVDGELWHGVWEGEESQLRRIDPQTGEALEALDMPPGVGVSGLESDGGDLLYCGGGTSGKVRAVRRPKRAADAPTGRTG